MLGGWFPVPGAGLGPRTKSCGYRLTAESNVCARLRSQGGEERFSVDWTASDDVILEVMSFSRPANLLSVLAYPLAAYQQYQFMKEGTGAVASYMEKLQKTRDTEGKR